MRREREKHSVSVGRACALRSRQVSTTQRRANQTVTVTDTAHIPTLCDHSDLYTTTAIELKFVILFIFEAALIALIRFRSSFIDKLLNRFVLPTVRMNNYSE